MRAPHLATSLSAILLAGALLGSGCGAEAASNSGLTAYLRVSNGQYLPGALPADDTTTGPKLVLTPGSTNVFPGASGRSVSGSADLSAVAIIVGLADDNAHWEIPVGQSDGDRNDPRLTFSTSLDFSPDIPLGKHEMRFQAVAADGTLGPIASYNINVILTPPTGTLVIQLTWDTEADLDLHVRISDPSVPKTGYFDVWNKSPLALPPKDSSEPPYTRAEITAAGKLLFDSNEQCVIDGARHEEIVFPGAYPAGPYEVRVDTFSLCGEPTARWHVAAFTNPVGGAGPALLAEAYGQSLDRDTYASHGADSGVLAFTFTPPPSP